MVAPEGEWDVVQDRKSNSLPAAKIHPQLTDLRLNVAGSAAGAAAPFRNVAAFAWVTRCSNQAGIVLRLMRVSPAPLPRISASRVNGVSREAKGSVSRIRKLTLQNRRA
jgi:hypothetical protein